MKGKRRSSAFEKPESSESNLIIFVSWIAFLLGFLSAASLSKLRLHLNALYNFRVLAETQFQLLDAQKWVRSRAINQKRKEAEIKLGSRLHGSEESRLHHEQ
ncbi:hypothetical protein LguiB_018187 [Lonicera macranthoides]